MEQTKLKIGFCQEYYTLWQLIDNKYYYLKNISKNIDTVKQQYPNVEIDESLHSYYQKTEYAIPEEVNPNIFQFGKYSGKNIIECNDFPYIVWYYSIIVDRNDSKYLEHIIKLNVHLTKNGKYIFTNNTWYSEEEYKKYLENKRIINRCLKLYKSGEKFTTEIKHNPNEEGLVPLPNIGMLKFNNLKEFIYNGYVYYLPVTNKKVRRIKNKCVTIEKYTFDEENVILNVEQFKVHKTPISEIL